jgi:hypothetical protein
VDADKQSTKEQLCAEMFQRLTTALEAEGASAAELQEYLRECEPCVEFVESLEKTLSLCRGYEVDAAIPERLASLLAPQFRPRGPESL